MVPLINLGGEPRWHFGAFTTQASRGVKVGFTTLSPILGKLVKLRSSAMVGLHGGWPA